MAKNDKLNLDDIDFDAALGVETEEAPQGLELDNLDGTKDDGQQADTATDEETKTDESGETQDDSGTNDAADGEADTTVDDGEELTLVAEIRGALGFEIEGDFEDTPEGLVNLAKAAASRVAQEQLDELFGALPDVQQYLQFRLNGGDSAQFFNTFYGDVNYSELKLEEQDSVTQEHLVRQAMILKGFEPEDVTESIQEFKNSGILYSQAQKAQKGLAKHQQREQARLVQEQERAAQEAQQQAETFWRTANETVQKSNELRGIPISEKDKKELIDYVSRPIKDGMSAFQVAMNEAPMDVYLAIAALMKRDFDLTGLVSRKAKTEQAKSLRERLSKGNEKLRSKPEGKKGVVDKPDFDTLDLTI